MPFNLSFSETGHSVVNRKPVSRIFHAKTTLGSQPAPRVAAFSSKGPNALTPEILKVKFLSRNSFRDAGFCYSMLHYFSCMFFLVHLHYIHNTC